MSLESATFGLNIFAGAICCYSIYSRYEGTHEPIRDHVNWLLAGVFFLLAIAAFATGHIARGVIDLALSITSYLLIQDSGGGGSLFKMKSLLPKWTR